MHAVSKWLRLSVVVCALLCASCLSLTLQTAKTTDSRLFGTWELTHQVDEKNEEKTPDPGTRTLLEFKEPDRIVFSRIQRRENDSDIVKKREGNFFLQQNEVHITDDGGNSVGWPYQIAGDTLITTMPSEKRKFYWRRTKP
ncbi:MAG: lipocalin family protein [Desulfomonile sp.]|nr:lipocalin family protein [Desulfomonile sp.]